MTGQSEAESSNLTEAVETLEEQYGLEPSDRLDRIAANVRELMD